MRADGQVAPHETVELLVRGQRLLLPPRTASLLYVSDKDPRDVRLCPTLTFKVSVPGGLSGGAMLPRDEPSTIFLRMPVSDSRCPTPPLDYYPSYAEMTPGQRWRYLHWLENPSRPISIAYVFVYYYGLERQLVWGDFDAAFDEVLMLRGHHDNPSLHHYSTRALTYAAMARSRLEVFLPLFLSGVTKGLSSQDLFFAYTKGAGLSADGLLAASHRIPGAKRRYLRQHGDLLRDTLNTCLIERYAEPAFPFAGRYSFDDLPLTGGQPLFANISFPPEIRAPSVPDFFKCESFLNDAREVLAMAHERVKRSLAEERKASRKSHFS